MEATPTPQQQPSVNISGEALDQLYRELGAKTHANYELNVQLQRVTAERDKAFDLLRQVQEQAEQGEVTVVDAEPTPIKAAKAKGSGG